MNRRGDGSRKGNREGNVSESLKENRSGNANGNLNGNRDGGAAGTGSPRDHRREIIRIGVPAILESLIAVVITAIDTRMIAPLGKAAVSAVSLTSQPKNLFFAIFFALGTAASIFVSQALGKKDRQEANAYFHAVLRLGFVISIVMGAAFLFLADPVMRICSRQAETIETSIIFFRVIMGLVVFQTMPLILNAALRGIGLTKVTLVSGVFQAAVDVLVNYLLIEGHWGFPALGVIGDALGTVAGGAAATVVSLVYMNRYSDFLTLKGVTDRRTLPPEGRKSIRSKAGNTVFENLFTRIGILISSVIISGLPADQTSVYFVAAILLSYTFAFGDGIQSAVVTLTGRSMGAGQPKEIRAYLKQALLIGTVLCAVLSAVYLLGGRLFYSQYFQDEAAISLGVAFNRVIAALTFLQILRIVIVGAMRGIGETRIPKRMALVCVLVISPAASLLLTEVWHFGVWGIWWATLVTQICWFLSAVILGRNRLRQLM